MTPCEREVFGSATKRIDPMRVVIAGGGTLGLTTAPLLTAERSGDVVVVLKKEDELDLHQTVDHSGVVHASVYYAAGSLKTRSSRRGVGLLRARCQERGQPYLERGKLVVAVDERELSGLDELERPVIANDVPNWDGSIGTGFGQSSPTRPEPRPLGRITGISSDPIIRIPHPRGKGVDAARVVTGARKELPAERVVVCVGLHADRSAHRSREDAGPRIIPFRGLYHRLPAERRWPSLRRSSPGTSRPTRRPLSITTAEGPVPNRDLGVKTRWGYRVEVASSEESAERLEANLISQPMPRR